LNFKINNNIGINIMLELFKDDTGKIIFSVVLGLGLAALFRQTCKDRKCLIIKCENPEEIKKNIYRHNKKCYNYKPYTVSCK